MKLECYNVKYASPNDRPRDHYPLRFDQERLCTVVDVNLLKKGLAVSETTIVRRYKKNKIDITEA